MGRAWDLLWPRQRARAGCHYSIDSALTYLVAAMVFLLLDRGARTRQNFSGRKASDRLPAPHRMDGDLRSTPAEVSQPASQPASLTVGPPHPVPTGRTRVSHHLAAGRRAGPEAVARSTPLRMKAFGRGGLWLVLSRARDDPVMWPLVEVPSRDAKPARRKVCLRQG